MNDNDWTTSTERVREKMKRYSLQARSAQWYRHRFKRAARAVERAEHTTTCLCDPVIAISTLRHNGREIRVCVAGDDASIVQGALEHEAELVSLWLVGALKRGEAA